MTMHGLLAVFLIAAAIPGQPLSVNVTQERDALMLDFELLEPPPESLDDGLPSGAVVRLSYLIQLRSDRRMMWDRRGWKGQLQVSAVFDPVTGRYHCGSVLDDIIVASDGIPFLHGPAHPRGSGTYARVLGHYARDKSALTLMEALGKMTILPAQRLEGFAPQMTR